MNISIHVPSWGTTEREGYLVRSILNFNPRSLVGNDSPEEKVADVLVDFNPRSLVGNDFCFRSEPGTHLYFNPRSLVGNDQSPRSCRRCPRYFNPRSLVGNDVQVRKPDAGLQKISIHVPSWGTTINPVLCCNSL